MHFLPAPFPYYNCRCVFVPGPKFGNEFRGCDEYLLHNNRGEHWCDEAARAALLG